MLTLPESALPQLSVHGTAAVRRIDLEGPCDNSLEKLQNNHMIAAIDTISSNGISMFKTTPQDNSKSTMEVKFWSKLTYQCPVLSVQVAVPANQTPSLYLAAMFSTIKDKNGSIVIQQPKAIIDEYGAGISTVNGVNIFFHTNPSKLFMKLNFMSAFRNVDVGGYIN